MAKAHGVDTEDSVVLCARKVDDPYIPRASDLGGVLPWLRALARIHGLHPRLVAASAKILAQGDVDPDALTPDRLRAATEATYKDVVEFKDENNRRMRDGESLGHGWIEVSFSDWIKFGTLLRPSPDNEGVQQVSTMVPRTKEKTMKVDLKVAQSVMTALGFKAADKWTRSVLEKKLNGLPKVKDIEEAEIEDDVLREIFEDLLASAKEGRAITVVEDEEDEEEAPAKPGKPGKPGKPAKSKKAPEPEEDADDKEDEEEAPAKPSKGAKSKKAPEPEEEAPAKPSKPAKGKKAPEAPAKGKKPEKKVGVVAVIVREFSKGTKKKPVTKEQVHAVLCKEFPDRDPNGMKNTVSAAPRWLHTDKDFIVKTNGEGGYWFEGKKED